MNIKRALGKVSSAYVRSARTFFLIFAVVGLVLWSFGAYAQQSGSLTLKVSNVSVTSNPGEPGFVNGWTTVSGKVTVSGSWNGGPIHFGGWFAVWGTDPVSGNTTMVNITLKSNAFTPSSLDYPSQTSATFTNTTDYGFISPPGGGSGSYPYAYLINAYDSNGNPVGSTGKTAVGATSGNNMYILIVQLPLINDSMLGATVQPSEPVIGQTGDMYNFILVVGIVLLLVGALVAIFLYREKGGLGAIIMNVVTSIVVILLFPMIYNEVARLVNTLDVAIITYPNFQPTPDAAISAIWFSAGFGSFSNFWQIIWTGIVQIAVWVMALIAWLMMNFLGIVRLLLIAVLTVAFPIAVGLRIIPFTHKLSDMVEDTLFGLILASIMSALVLGVTANVLNNYNNSIFNTAIGSQPDVLAIAAIFAAILMPTVFAPLTGIMMQTISQAAMTSAGVAAMVIPGIGGTAAKGAWHGAQAGMGAFSTAMQQAGPAKSLGQAVKTGFGALTAGAKSFAGTFLRHAGPHVLKNAALIGATGVATAFGASAAAQAVSHMAGGLSTPADVTMSVVRAQAMKGIQSAFSEVTGYTNKGKLMVPHEVFAPDGSTFRMPNLPPINDPHQDNYFVGIARRNKNMSDERIIERLIRGNLVSKEILKDPAAVKELARRHRDFYAHLDPHKPQDKLALINSKIYYDYMEWHAKHFGQGVTTDRTKTSTDLSPPPGKKFYEAPPPTKESMPKQGPTDITKKKFTPKHQF